jgi:hypothetical protein
MITKICQGCGKTIQTTQGLVNQGHGKYCTNKCFHQHRKGQTTAICQICSKEFYTKPSYIAKGYGKYCGKKCQSVSQKGFKTARFAGGLIEKPCEICGEILYTNRDRIEKGIAKYCSQECRYKGQALAMTGENSPAWKGGKVKCVCTVCKKEFEVSQYQAAQRKYCNKTCKDKDVTNKYSGENSCHWKGGITPIHLAIRMSTPYKEWRLQVFKRDSYKCVKCGKKGDIKAHHIIPFSVDKSLRLELTNGITLCKACHAKEHKANKEQQLNIFSIYYPHRLCKSEKSTLISQSI